MKDKERFHNRHHHHRAERNKDAPDMTTPGPTAEPTPTAPTSLGPTAEPTQPPIRRSQGGPEQSSKGPPAAATTAPATTEEATDAPTAAATPPFDLAHGPEPVEGPPELTDASADALPDAPALRSSAATAGEEEPPEDDEDVEPEPPHHPFLGSWR
jgi:hypothetical protein